MIDFREMVCEDEGGGGWNQIDQVQGRIFKWVVLNPSKPVVIIIIIVVVVVVVVVVVAAAASSLSVFTVT
jgi:hypothetical protein